MQRNNQLANRVIPANDIAKLLLDRTNEYYQTSNLIANLEANRVQGAQLNGQFYHIDTLRNDLTFLEGEMVACLTLLGHNSPKAIEWYFAAVADNNVEYIKTFLRSAIAPAYQGVTRR